MSAKAPTLKTYQYFWRLIRYSAPYFITDTTTAAIFWLSFTVTGLILRGYFNYLTDETGFTLPLVTVVILQIVYAIVAGLALAAAILANTTFRQRSMALMIRNMLKRVLELPGAKPLPIDKDGKRMSSGQVISTLRDDTNEIVDAITVVEDTLGLGITALISLVIMLGISPLVTIGTFIPLGLIIFVSFRLGPRVEKYREASREATSQVTGIIADMFNSTEAIKVANAEERIINHFRQLNDQRRTAIIKDRLLSEFVRSLSSGSVDIGMGLVLLLAAQLIYTGNFTVGDFALFAAYLWPMTQLMRMTGWLFTLYRQSGVSFERMERMMQGIPPGGPVDPHPSYLSGAYPELSTPVRTAEDRLETLQVNGLTYYHESEEDERASLQDVSFKVSRGSFTVITGRIGSGKSTLLKALLGLVPAHAGEILWNGELVIDPASFFLPPRCAYTGQVPRLFSESLQENILLGLPEQEVDLRGAVHQAVMEVDVQEMEHGLDTLVGPRGIRLSGGQIQRTAAARMFVREAELLVFDDLSSALDVETERLLWERLFSRPGQARYIPTCLVVSHRRAVLQRADQIILMADGCVEDIGRLDELLARSPEMRRLWLLEAHIEAGEINE